MTYSDIDEIIEPRESGLFRGYLPNSLNVETRNNSRQFTEDLIGLGTLWKQGKLFMFTSHVKHQDFKLLYAAIEELAGWIRSTYPGIYVVSIEIGNNSQGSIIVRDTLQRCSLLLFILITLSGYS